MPTVAATLVTRPAAVLRLALDNDGQKAVTFTRTPNDFTGDQRIVSVTAGHAEQRLPGLESCLGPEPGGQGRVEARAGVRRVVLG